MKSWLWKMDFGAQIMDTENGISIIDYGLWKMLAVVPKDTNESKIIEFDQNDSKWSYFGHKSSHMVPNGPTWSQTAQMVPHGPKRPKWSKMISNYIMIQHGSKLSQYVQICPKFSQMVPNGPKCSQRVPNDSIQSQTDFLKEICACI